ncbi:hypothetical protein D3C80_714390 [compost metagenome]
MRNRLDRQALHLGAETVTTDTRGTGINHVLDAGHGQRGFRDVGRQHDAPPVMRLEYPVLFAVRQTGIQRQDLGMQQIKTVQGVGGVANFALAAHEDQNIPRPFAAQLIYRIENRLQLIAVDIVGIVHYRTITHLDRISTTRDFDNRRVIEMARKTLRIDSRRSDDDFEIRALWQQFTQVTQDEINVQAAFVRFIDNQRVVLHQQPVLLDFRQQDPVGHQLDQGVFADLIVKAHLITDAAA